MLSPDLPSTIPALLGVLVRERGHHPAILTSEEQVSYARLEQRSASIARALLAAGAGKGTRIGLLAPDGIFWVSSFLGALRIGAVVSAISTLCTPGELAQTLRASDCQFLLCVPRFLNHDYRQILRAALPGLKATDSGHIFCAEAPYLRSIWMDEARGQDAFRSIEEMQRRSDACSAEDDARLAAAENEVSPEDLAVVVYTSGSTTRPKAVMHRQWTLVRHPPELAKMFVQSPEDRMMPLLPAFWLAGMAMTLQVLSVGATLVYPDSPDSEAALDAIQRFKVNRVNAWGDKQPALVSAARARELDIEGIPDLSGFRDVHGNKLPGKIPMYGMTESFSAHSAWPLNTALPAGKESSFGCAINNYERRVVDPKTGVELAPGEIGELQIRGPAMAVGLYKMLRSEVFTADGFYPTRDLVRIDAEGFLYPAGRLDDMIKTRGANVSRLEVEAALVALPEVELAVVAGLPDPEFGEVVAAAVVPSATVDFSEAALRSALREKLSTYKIPRHIVTVDHSKIPRTATGKIKLSAVAEMIAAKIRLEDSPSQ